jgi:ribosome-associated protein
MAFPDSRGAKRTSTATPVAVRLPITVGQFVKLAGLAGSGGEAKQLVVDGEVRVNGRVETRRGHKLEPGDVVDAKGLSAGVVATSRD